MVTAILSHTPSWVWILLTALVALGVWQSIPRHMSLRRATMVPLAMVGLSLYGVSSTFAGQGVAMAAWLIGGGATVLAAQALGAWPGIVWLHDEQRLQIPGSLWPMALILCIFITKFAVGVTLGMTPSRAADPQFAAEVSLAYGAFSGVFMSRGLRMWRVAHAAVAPAVRAR